MKNKHTLIFIFLFFAVRVSAQVFVIADSYQSSTVTAGVTVGDSLTTCAAFITAVRPEST